MVFKASLSRLSFVNDSASKFCDWSEGLRRKETLTSRTISNSTANQKLWQGANHKSVRSSLGAGLRKWTGHNWYAFDWWNLVAALNIFVCTSIFSDRTISQESIGNHFNHWLFHFSPCCYCYYGRYCVFLESSKKPEGESSVKPVRCYRHLLHTCDSRRFSEK